jgi:adenosylcobinamide-phosphate synthase
VSLFVAGAVLLAFVLDAAVAELPTRFHPVAWFGKGVAPFDREWTRPRAVGSAVAVLLPLAAAVAVGSVVVLAGGVAAILAAIVAGLALFVTTSLRLLLSAAREVVTATETDIDTARERLRALAGRDASDLSPGAIRSAAVESVAENLADGLVAPLGVFAVAAIATEVVTGHLVAALAVAAGAATWVKAVNTLDSMLGYHSKAVGTPSAKLDDAVMFVPARVSSALLAAAALTPRAVVAARSHARVPASPNSGWPMATMAAALGVRLSKSGHYDLRYGPAFPSVADAERAVRVAGVAGVLAYSVSVLAALAVTPAGPDLTSGVTPWF